MKSIRRTIFNFFIIYFNLIIFTTSFEYFQLENKTSSGISNAQHDTYSIFKPTELLPTCGPDLTYNEVTQSCVDNETAARIETRPSCKNITLTPDLVTIKSDYLYIIGRKEKFSLNEYTVENDNSVQLCFPFTPKFRGCERWGVYPNEYELENGGLILRLTQSDTTVDTGDFSTSVINDEKFGVICIANSRAKTHVIDAYATSWIISAISLFVSLLIYAITNRKLTYQTKTMMCHMFSLFIFYLLLTIRAWGPEFESSTCIVYSVIVHYFFLASFFWINVLAFDIWKNLPRFTIKMVTPSKDRRRFIYMSLYAWGLPVLIAFSALLTDLLVAEESDFRPQFARQCWFMGLQSKIVFLYGPAAVIIVANIIFFVLTVWSLMRLSKDAVMVNKKIHSQLTRMYLKLLIVMGLCWIMEIISGVVDKDQRYWYFTDIINGLQGFFLFLVYVCKANVLRDLLALWEKHVGVGRGLCLKFSSTSKNNSAPSRNISSTVRTNSVISVIQSSEITNKDGDS